MSVHPVEVAAHAKANLFLRVLGREADGYHAIETLFCRLDLADTLRAERREGEDVTVEVLGAEVGPPETNLAVRAARMVLDAHRTPPDAGTGDQVGEPVESSGTVSA